MIKKTKLHNLRFKICTASCMLHWRLKKIFFLNRLQIPQCDSWTCALVTTLLRSYLPTMVAENCKQATLILVKYDAGQGGKKPKQFYLGHTNVVYVCVLSEECFRLKVDEKHPNRHVTATAVGSLLCEYISYGVQTHCEERCSASPYFASGQWPDKRASLT